MLKITIEIPCSKKKSKQFIDTVNNSNSISISDLKKAFGKRRLKAYEATAPRAVPHTETCIVKIIATKTN